MSQRPNTKEELQQAVDAVARHGSVMGASRALNMPRATLINRLEAAKRNGIASSERPIAGTSTLYGPDGEVKLQWVKQTAKEKTIDEWQEAIKEVFGDLRVPKLHPARKQRTSDLLAVYPIGDHHVGMYAWKAETGADYDIKIARQLLVSSVQHLMTVAPDTETGLIVNVGDFFHVDNLKNETSRSGHTLDVDTRYRLMIEAGVDMLRTAINIGLTKHKRMHVICTPGNHDDIGAQWLSMTLKLLYQNNPRVTVDSSPSKFHYFQFGKVLIGVTHGDTGKPEKLAGVMAADKPEMWGSTEFRYWLTGHVHNRAVIEMPGVMWETFRTLAARDAWANSSGYRSGRDMWAIVFHKDLGELARHRFDVKMLEAT